MDAVDAGGRAGAEEGEGAGGVEVCGVVPLKDARARGFFGGGEGMRRGRGLFSSRSCCRSLSSMVVKALGYWRFGWELEFMLCAGDIPLLPPSFFLFYVPWSS